MNDKPKKYLRLLIKGDLSQATVQCKVWSLTDARFLDGAIKDCVLAQAPNNQHTLRMTQLWFSGDNSAKPPYSDGSLLFWTETDEPLPQSKKRYRVRITYETFLEEVPDLALGANLYQQVVLMQPQGMEEVRGTFEYDEIEE